MNRATMAGAVFAQFDQAQTDGIVRAVYEAGFNNRVKLAKMAVEETGLGIWEHKVQKNVLATQFVYEDIRDLKTCGIISEDHESGIMEIAQPMGPILAIIPVTNPTSTVLFKILTCLKTRNPVIICPSKKAVDCCSETARICYEAALKADAPEDCIQWLTEVSRDQTHALMQHLELSLILATGGSSLVHDAYSSGTPALGVGAGNVPVFIEKTADVPFAVEQILLSKTFDNGTICASEQALVVEESIAGAVEANLVKNHAVLLNPEQREKLEAIAWNPEKKLMNANVVGKPATWIAEQAGIDVPEDTRLLVVPLDGIGKDYPLSSEVLAPILAYYTAKDFAHAINLCIDLNYHGGIGHTASIFSNDEESIREFSLMMNAGRILVNTPSSQGAVGALFNKLNASLTLGCGTGGKNITTHNITARDLLNIQRVTKRRINTRLEHFDADKYLDESLDVGAIEADFNRNY